jgi:hypothetical protein
MNAETFFRQNEHLPFDRAERMQVSNAFELLKTSFPDCVKLESCVASSSVIGRIVSAAESAVSSNVSRTVLWCFVHRYDHDFPLLNRRGPMSVTSSRG